MKTKMKIPNTELNLSVKKQRGATLFTALVFLVLMTIVSVSAVKLSIFDILFAGNNQQKMVLFQDTANELKRMATIRTLNSTYTETGFTGNESDDVFRVVGSPANTEERVTDLSLRYPCEREGVGSSIGANAPPCNLYDFEVRTRVQGTGARDQHNRGAGKMVPNSGSKGSLL